MIMWVKWGEILVIAKSWEGVQVGGKKKKKKMLFILEERLSLHVILLTSSREIQDPSQSK